MIQLHITHTSKSFNPSDSYRIYDEETKNFNNLKDAKDFLKEEYGNCKRSNMYNDNTPGKVIGYIYGFKNADYSHSPVEKWLQQDWVDFNKVTYSRITL